MKTWLFNPFRYVAGARALIYGWAAMLLTSVVAWLSGVHFDGVIDAHIGRRGSWGMYAVEGVIDWLAVTLVFYASGRMLSSSAIRLIDVAGTMALARYPMFFAAWVGFLPVSEVKSLSDIGPVFWVVTAVFIVTSIWMIALMFNAFRVSCNVKGGQAVGGFIAGLLIAEVLSKLALYSLYKI